MGFAGETARLTVDARRGDNTFLNDLTMEANLVAPDGTVTALTLPQVAPGRYETDFTPEQEGAYLVRVTGTAAGEEEAVVAQTTGWVLGYSPEYRQLETNFALLQALADVTGGRNVGDDPAGVFEHSLPSEATTRPVWPWLTLLAVVLLPVDIALRRLVITQRDLARAWAATFGRWQRPQTSLVQERQAQVSRLFEAKRRASVPRPGPEAPPPIEATPPSPSEVATPRPGPAPPAATTPPAGSLAARLLEKRRQQDEANHPPE